MRRRSLLLAGVTVAAAATVAGAMVFGGLDGADARNKNVALPPATADIVRTDLQVSKTVDGRLDYAERRTVKSAVDGTVTVAAKEGEIVAQGQRLYELNDKPVTLLYGQVPMFRDMKIGDRGTDVLQLKIDLRDLGYGEGLYVDSRYDQATEAAVKEWQKSLNREPTGKVGKGDVVFQPDKVKVITADAALADQVGPGKPVLTAASTKPVVLAPLDQSDVTLTEKGTKVEVNLPDGKTEPGKVTGTVQPEKPASGSAPASDAGNRITVEVTLDSSGSAATGENTKATVSVKFVSESHKGVLAVPVEAVVALRGESGGYGLQLVQGTTTKMVHIDTGMTADGKIEVSGPELRAGMKVGVARQ